MTQATRNPTAAPPGRWARALDGDTDALSELAGSYWYCVYAWWRRSGRTPEDAALATVASFTRWLEETPPRAEDSGSGRLREWLPARLSEVVEHGLDLTSRPAMAIEPERAEERYQNEPPGEPDELLQQRWA